MTTPKFRKESLSVLSYEQQQRVTDELKKSYIQPYTITISEVGVMCPLQYLKSTSREKKLKYLQNEQEFFIDSNG
jgi:1,2-phenylacetyl-CoA epoxidase catalytic subunit